jgi:hypothetical protein
MPAPPSAGTTSFKQQGYTQLWWGTEALPLGNYIAVSCRPKQRADTIETQQGSGLTAVVTQVVDGSDFEITVEEDLTITPPHVGSLVILENIFVSGAALGNTIPPFGATAITNGNFLVINNDFNAERKAVGQRVLLCKSYVALNAANGGGNPNI